MKRRNEIKYQKLNGEEQIEKLRALIKILNCRGSKAGIKSISTSAGYSIYTTSSQRLLQYLEINDPLLLFISQSIKSQLQVFNDFGLFNGLLITSLLEQIYFLFNDEIPVKIIKGLLTNLIEGIHQILHSNQMKIELNFSSIHQILPFIRGILNSKPAVQLSTNELESLTLKLTKASIEKIDDIEGIHIKCDTEIGQQIGYVSGIIYSWPDELSAVADLLEQHHKWNFLLFDLMLDDISFQDAILNLIERIQVNLVISQKVIHPHIQFALRRRRVLVLERMGRVLTKYLIKMTGAEPISDIAIQEDKIEAKQLISVDLVTYGSKNFIKLEGENKIITLLVPSKSEETSYELQVVCNQALSSLQLFIRNPCIMPGGGCAETRLIALLLLLQKDRLNIAHEKNFFQSVLKSFMLASQISSTNEFDTIYGHLWTDSSQERCRCKLYSASDIRDRDGKWHFIIEMKNCLKEPLKEENIPLNFIPASNALLDIYPSKRGSIELALQSVLEIFEVGMIIAK